MGPTQRPEKQWKTADSVPSSPQLSSFQLEIRKIGKDMKRLRFQKDIDMRIVCLNILENIIFTTQIEFFPNNHYDIIVLHVSFKGVDSMMN